MHRIKPYFKIGFLLFFLSPSLAENLNISVIYSELKSSSVNIFSLIIQGIKQHPKTQVTTLPFLNADDMETIEKRLHLNPPTALITQGTSGYQQARHLEGTLKIVSGGLLLTPNGHSGVSLDGDPKLFFAQLNRLAPQVNRVSVVYNPLRSGWLVKMAEAVAAQYDLELKAYPAENTREAMRHYRTVLDQAKAGQDAIWLPLDNIAPSKVVLPLLLKEAWSKNLVLFSNNPLHAKKGVLFALFPNHIGLGQQLADLAVTMTQADLLPMVQPSQHLRVAVNRRTASHLGIHLSKRQQQAFDLVYPSR